MSVVDESNRARVLPALFLDRALLLNGHLGMAVVNIPLQSC